MKIAVLTILAMCAVALSPTLAQTLTTRPTEASDSRAAPPKNWTPDAFRPRTPPPPPLVIREPSQGRPVFVKPNGEFYFVMRLMPKMSPNETTYWLVHALEPTASLSLSTATPPAVAGNEYVNLVLRVPPDAMPGLYDLEARSKTTTHRSRRCVKVVDRFKTQFRFVHLSNMNVGDTTCPDFDPTLPTEVNLLAPEFILATGNFTEWSRAFDDAASWSRVLDYLARFDAPVFILCGLHDHEASFSQYVANGPVGTVDYGSYHGLLLNDHPGHPIDRDADQLRFADADLQRHADSTFNFIVVNSDELRLLDAWRQRGDLAARLSRDRVRLLIAGGSSDWDYAEFAGRMVGLAGFDFVRTHQSSTCLRDRSTGVSHYRIFEVDGDQVCFVYPADRCAERLQHSVPAGRLRVTFDGPTDGSSDRLTATVQNNLNQAFRDARLWFRVAKRFASGPPTVAGGALLRAIPAGKYWACEVACDLPDKATVRVMAASARDLPPAPALAVSVEGPSELVFTERVTDFGLSYASSSQSLTLVVRNQGPSPATCWPIARLNGTQLRVDAGGRLPVSIRPGETLRLPLVLSLPRVDDGTHMLSVHLLDDPLARLTTFDVRTRMTAAVAGSEAAGNAPAGQVIRR